MNKLSKLLSLIQLQRLAIWMVAGCLGLAIEVGVEHLGSAVHGWIAPGAGARAAVAKSLGDLDTWSARIGRVMVHAWPSLRAAKPASASR